MIINESKFDLKGQHTLAQGNALGLKKGEKIVRVMSFFKGHKLFRTKMENYNSLENNELHLRPKEAFCIDYLFSTDGFRFMFITQDVALG
jgi:hypothetical protein